MVVVSPLPAVPPARSAPVSGKIPWAHLRPSCGGAARPGGRWANSIKPRGTDFGSYTTKKPSPTGPIGTTWGFPKLSSGGGGGNAIITIILRQYLHFIFRIENLPPFPIMILLFIKESKKIGNVKVIVIFIFNVKVGVAYFFSLKTICSNTTHKC